MAAKVWEHSTSCRSYRVSLELHYYRKGHCWLKNVILGSQLQPSSQFNYFNLRMYRYFLYIYLRSLLKLSKLEVFKDFSMKNINNQNSNSSTKVYINFEERMLKKIYRFSLSGRLRLEFQYAFSAITVIIYHHLVEQRFLHLNHGTSTSRMITNQTYFITVRHHTIIFHQQFGRILKLQQHLS